jgi:ATPase subunit of ABC transporter with duplicated ATPase domains
MSLLNVSGIAFRYPSTEFLFEDATLSIDPGDRVAIVGANGSGKSTLLGLLAGRLEPARGSIVRRQGMVIRMAEQEPHAGPGCTLFDYVVRGWPESADASWEDAEAVRALTGLGFSYGELDLELDCLSGGQRTRAALARALLGPSDLLLLDEPTNHLDIPAREWLDEALAARREACLVVSHDRALLAGFARRVAEIERGKLTVFEGSYQDYRARRALLDRQAWAGYNTAERRRQAAEKAAQWRDHVARQVAKAPAGARHGKDYYTRKAGKVSRTGRLLRERASEDPVEKPWEEREISSLSFDDVPRGGDVVLTAAGLAKSYGAKCLFSGLALHLRRGDRLAILGANGAGKTTLLRILAGEEAADAGQVLRGANVRLARLTQDASDLDPARSALDLCGTDSRARTLLGCLKLRPDRVNRPARELSAGERSKVALVRLLLSGANLLLLDEPTNHLEVEAQEALEAALQRYPGALVVVSHDRAFLAALDPTCLALAEGAVPNIMVSRKALS